MSSLIEITHAAHILGDFEHSIATIANTLFAIALAHGGYHWGAIHWRRYRIVRNKAKGVRERA